MTNNPSLRRHCAAASLCALAALLLLAPGSGAQGQAPKKRLAENRFLFVIDTSAAMKSRANGVAEAVTGLLGSGMKGELRKGDTIGVWTYADTINTDFPKQVWSAGKKDEIVQQTREFLGGLRYEKRAHLDRVMPDILNLVARSQRLTVILVFDGSETITGTPFDDNINELHKQFARQFRSEHEPFVTILSSLEGRIFDFTINHPRTIKVPHTAELAPPAETNAPPAVVAAAPSTTAAIPPPPATNAPSHKFDIVLTGSNFAHHASAPPVVSDVPPDTAPAPAAASNPVPSVAAAPAAGPAVIANVAPPETGNTTLAAAPTVAAIPQPATTVAAAAEPTTPKAVAAPATPPVTTSAPDARRANASGVPAVPVAAAVPVAQLTAIYIIALSLLTIAVVLVLFLIRRWRRSSGASLISQSIDRSR